jgi:hypothetical protein
VLERYQPDALRYFICAAGPETSDSDFTFSSCSAPAPMARIEQVSELDPGSGAGLSTYPVITGDCSATPRWESRPVVAGTPVAKPTPIFTKLVPAVIDEELARLGQ